MPSLLVYLIRLLSVARDSLKQGILRRLRAILLYLLPDRGGEGPRSVGTAERAGWWAYIWRLGQTAAAGPTKPFDGGMQVEKPKSHTPGDRRSPVHALVIGIDTYESKRIVPLRGAASDADAIEEYLRKDLHVPGDQIVNLRNETATRGAILRELRALAHNSSICKNDPIIIFFAGHGASAKAPSAWTGGGVKFSMLVPYDSFCVDEMGQHILPIPDRTVGGLLHFIAEGDDPDEGIGKGNNITVIFDCCHSGSGTRDFDYAPMCLERGFEIEEENFIPPSLDEYVWGKVPEDHALDMVSGFAKFGLNSHVLLAACRESEVAHEENHRGKFTGALLHALREVEAHKITYKDLMHRITETMKDQTPQCEGRFSDRILFNALAPSTPRATYTVSHKDEMYTIDAGSVHGIMAGAEFAIYSTRDFTSRDTPLATMIAQDVGSFSTELSFVSDYSLELPLPCFASQTSSGRANALRLHIPQSSDRGPVLNTLRAELDEADYPVLLEEKEARADLSIREHDGHVEYFVNDSIVKSFGLQKLYRSTDAETRYIHSVLRAATHFFWHFNRSPDLSLIRDGLSVQVHELRMDEEAELDLHLRAPYKPHGENINHGGIVDVIANDMTAYGVTVESRLDMPLHVWVFYFDCSDLSISEYFQPPAFGVRGEPALPARGTLTIGYGAGGGQPFKYYLRPDQELDVGFIKLFVSTQPVDLSSIIQRSPFSTLGVGERATREMSLRLTEDTWDTIVISVVQRKPLRKAPHSFTHFASGYMQMNMKWTSQRGSTAPGNAAPPA